MGEKASGTRCSNQARNHHYVCFCLPTTPFPVLSLTCKATPTQKPHKQFSPFTGLRELYALSPIFMSLTV